MSQIQLFQKDWKNIDQYKQSITKWYNLWKENNLPYLDYVNFVYTKTINDINNWTIFQRQDLLYFGDNLEIIIQNIQLKNWLITKSKNFVQNWSNQLEIWFNIISLAQDLLLEYQQELLAKEKQESEQKKLDQIHIQEHLEYEKNQKEIENLLNDL